MADPISGASPTATVTGDPSNAPGSATPAGTTTPGETTFTPSGVDLAKLAPEVRAEIERINKDMVRGFTAKTQELAGERKKYADYDSLKEKASSYQQFAENEEFVKRWNAYVEETAGKNGSPDPAVESLKKDVAEMKTNAQKMELMTAVEAFADAKDEKTGEKLRPDFNKLDEVKISDNLSLLSASIQTAQGKNPLEKLQNGYANAKKVFDEIFESGRKAGLERIGQKLRNGSEMPTGSITGGVFTGDPKKITVSQAMDLAKKGVTVPRD